MNEPERRTREARLLVSAPEAVYQELREYARTIAADRYGNYDQEMEQLLLSRGDPLIDLALGSYATDREVVSAIYKKALLESSTSEDARYRAGLRIACLSNQVVDKWFFPNGILAEDELHHIYFDAPWNEAEALLSNQNASDRILVSLYRRTTPFDQLPDDRWCDLVSMSSKNPRLTTRNDTESGPDLGHMEIEHAIFDSLGVAPLTPRGFHTAYNLIDGVDPQYAYHPESIDAELARWTSVQINDFKGNTAEGHFTPLPMVDEFRCLIAALYGKSYGKTETRIHGSAKSSDVVERCAYYGNGNLDLRAMKTGHEKDGDIFTFAALHNDHILFDSKLRKLLEDEYLRGLLIGRYRRISLYG
jgi:hypothetical protein